MDPGPPSRSLSSGRALRGPVGSVARDDCKNSLNLGRNLLQNSNEPPAVACADQVIEIAFVPARAARQRVQDFLSGGRDVQAIGAAVAVHALTFDKPAPHQILDHGREAGLVAAIGEGQPVWLMPGLRAISVKVAKRPGLSPISCERRENAWNAASWAMRRLKPTQ